MRICFNSHTSIYPLNIGNPEMSDITRNELQKYSRELIKIRSTGPLWELNPRPLAPKARIIPLDQTAFLSIHLISLCSFQIRKHFVSFIQHITRYSLTHYKVFSHTSLLFLWFLFLSLWLLAVAAAC